MLPPPIKALYRSLVLRKLLWVLPIMSISSLTARFAFEWMVEAKERQIISIVVFVVLFSLVLILENYFSEMRRLGSAFQDLSKQLDQKIYFVQGARWLPNGVPKLLDWLFGQYPTGQLVLAEQGLYYIGRPQAGIHEEVIFFGALEQVRLKKKFPFAIAAMQVAEGEQQKAYFFVSNTFRGLMMVLGNASEKPLIYHKNGEVSS